MTKHFYEPSLKELGAGFVKEYTCMSSFFMLMGDEVLKTKTNEPANTLLP